MLTAIVVCGLIGILALAVDVGFVFSSRTQYQNGIDAAALAAVNGLRVSIEDDSLMPKQREVVEQLAIKYAGLNQVRLYADPNRNNIQLKSDLVEVERGDLMTGIPKVKVNTGDGLETPLFFAGVFGLKAIRVNAYSMASLFPVDGGTGTFGGCWRPIFLPDTFFDANGRVHYAGNPARAPLSRLPNQQGDFYRSRFAVGTRFVEPFKDGAAQPVSPVTGLRDTPDKSDVGVRTIMGYLNVSFTPQQYFIAKFSELPVTAAFAPNTRNFANVGYCGRIGVSDPDDPTGGNEISVYAQTDLTAYDDLRRGLESLKTRTDPVDEGLKNDYRYITSLTFPDPNSSIGIIPVLLFDPFLLNTDPDRIRTLKVTNIGLFYLDQVMTDGTIEGFFVREIITGGTPISLANFSEVDLGDAFKRRWLPMSAQLLR